MTSGRQVVQHLADHGIILNFQLVTVFEHQHRLRLVGDWSFRRRRRRRRFRFCWGSTRPRRVSIGVGASRGSGAAPVEDRGTTTVILVILLLLRVRRRIITVGLYRNRVGYVNRPTPGEKLSAVMAMTREKRRTRIHREQGIDAARLIGKRVPGLNTVRSQRSDARGYTGSGIEVSAKIDRGYRCRCAIDLRNCRSRS